MGVTPDISQSAQRFLSLLTERNTVEILELITLFERMSPECRQFLERAEPTTLKWLSTARADEINQLKEGLNLVRATRTLGRFSKWALLTIVGLFGASFALSDYVVRMINYFRGH